MTWELQVNWDGKTGNVFVMDEQRGVVAIRPVAVYLTEGRWEYVSCPMSQ